VSGDWDLSLGVTFLGDDRARFLVWAPLARKVEVHLLAPPERLVRVQSRERSDLNAESVVLRPLRQGE
jgi:1,4-alpha-glucan branching enzyme